MKSETPTTTPDSHSYSRSRFQCWRNVLFLSLISMASLGHSQTLDLPPRPVDARNGSEVARLLIPLRGPSLADARRFSARDAAICGQILQGNVPNWMRKLVLITSNGTIDGRSYSVSYYVTPDYLAIGSDTDYFLTPMSPLLAQYIADQLGCSLPTSKMSDDIWKNAPIQVSPAPIPPTPDMGTVPVFIKHNRTVESLKSHLGLNFPMGTLTAGSKKDIIISGRMTTSFVNRSVTNPVVIYGWHQATGNPVQPVYNGHDENYVDYSHCVRLVQMEVTVDGERNTVTNIVTNPRLAGLLSDDPYYTDHVIPNPRYRTLTATAPIITTHPIRQTLPSGSTVRLTAFAFGDQPISYQWQWNGMDIKGATSSTLTLRNIEPAEAGLFGVVVSNRSASTKSIPALVRVQNQTHPILFEDDFDRDRSKQWNVTWSTVDGIDDYSVDWAHDYSSESYTFNGAGYFIPPSPNSRGTSKGVKLTVNNNDTSGSIIGLNLYPKHRVFSNDYAVKFDMWLSYPGGFAGTNAVGSTELALFGMNHNGDYANWAAPTALRTDGLWFAVSSDGGLPNDYRSYVGDINGTQTEWLGAGSGLSESNNTAAVFQTLFPASRAETPGTPGKQWVEVELRQVGGTITWLMNGTILAQRKNTSAFNAGTIMLGYMDIFPSVASPAEHAFVLFDNVRVEDLTRTLEPETASSQFTEPTLPQPSTVKPTPKRSANNQR